MASGSKLDCTLALLASEERWLEAVRDPVAFLGRSGIAVPKDGRIVLRLRSRIRPMEVSGPAYSTEGLCPKGLVPVWGEISRAMVCDHWIEYWKCWGPPDNRSCLLHRWCADPTGSHLEIVYGWVCQLDVEHVGG